MRRSIVMLGILVLAACGDDGHHDDHSDPVVVESASLVRGEFDSCDVVGQLLNTDGDLFCDVFVSFNARNSSDTIIADAITSISSLPPNTRAIYSAKLLRFNGDFVSCREIASFEVSELNQFCD
jgi:hypothetical protein